MDVVMKELFGTDIGLLSLFTIGFIIAMGLFIWYRTIGREAGRSLERGYANSPVSWARLVP